MAKHLVNTIPIILCTTDIVIMRIWKPRPSSTNPPFLNQGHLGSHQPRGYLADPPWCDANSLPPGVFDGESLFNYKSRQNLSSFTDTKNPSHCWTPSHQGPVFFKEKEMLGIWFKAWSRGRNPSWLFFVSTSVRDLQRFASSHDAGLLEYNSSLREKREFQGTRLQVLKISPWVFYPVRKSWHLC